MSDVCSSKVHAGVLEEQEIRLGFKIKLFFQNKTVSNVVLDLRGHAHVVTLTVVLLSPWTTREQKHPVRVKTTH